MGGALLSRQRKQACALPPGAALPAGVVLGPGRSPWPLRRSATSCAALAGAIAAGLSTVFSGRPGLCLIVWWLALVGGTSLVRPRVAEVGAPAGCAVVRPVLALRG